MAKAYRKPVDPPPPPPEVVVWELTVEEAQALRRLTYNHGKCDPSGLFLVDPPREIVASLWQQIKLVAGDPTYIPDIRPKP